MKYRDFKAQFQGLPYFTHQSLVLLGHPMQTLQNQMRLWEKRGYLLRLRRGWYTLAEHERSVSADLLVLASHMVTPSYVSLEWALSFYGLIPEQATLVTSVTTQKTQFYRTPIGSFQYRNIKLSGFNGFVEKRSADGFVSFLATPEKALVDFIYYHLSEIDPKESAIFESSYRFHHLSNLDWQKIHRFSDNLGSKKLTKVIRLLHDWALDSEGATI